MVFSTFLFVPSLHKSSPGRGFDISVHQVQRFKAKSQDVSIKSGGGERVWHIIIIPSIARKLNRLYPYVILKKLKIFIGIYNIKNLSV